MGIAAGQARIFLLTARDHDLTYRGNQLVQERLMLASSQERIATEYARKTANRQIMFTTTVVQDQGNSRVSRNLTWQQLYNSTVAATSGDGSSAGKFRVKNADGNVVVTSTAQISTLSGSSTVSGPVNGVYTSGGQTYVVDTNMRDQSETYNYFQEGLRNGVYFIEQELADPTDGSVRNWTSVSWSGHESFSDDLYTKDDAEAKAIYDAQMSKVQSADKKLEIDQKSIETQHKMVTTEKESVIKLTLKNAEAGSKTFNA